MVGVSSSSSLSSILTSPVNSCWYSSLNVDYFRIERNTLGKNDLIQSSSFVKNRVSIEYFLGSYIKIGEFQEESLKQMYKYIQRVGSGYKNH